MQRQHWILTGKFASVLSIPLMLWAYPDGAPRRATGAPGDNTCIQSSCHIGTTTSNSPLLSLSFEGGTSYTPGTRQRFTLTLTDPARNYGFQASARLESNPSSAQAGTFTPVGTTTYVLCDNNIDRPASGCPASAPVEFITHSRAGSTTTFSFDWTPPATAAAGPVVIYVAGNANNGPGANGAKLHLKSLRLTPVGVVSPKPTISSGGVVSASSFGGGSTVAPGSWIEIFGKDLSTTTRSWAGSDFNGSTAPTSLDGVSVQVDGLPAFVNYISPTQVNVQVPADIAQAPIEVVLTNSLGRSEATTITGAARAPGILAPPSFIVGGRQYLVAQFADGTYAGRPGLIAGLNFRAPIPGDRIVIYGVGFGQVNPAINPGSITTVASDLGSSFRAQLGTATAVAEFKGLAPNFVGLYQFNLVVPNIQAADHEVTFEIDGVKTKSGVYLTTAN